MSVSSDKIFVAIAAYRDAETLPTIQSALRHASNRQRVTFGVCWQHKSPEDDHLYPTGCSKRLRVRSFRAEDSKGAGWARTIAHGLREDEPYVLQVDSHMRFHQGWDDVLLQQLARCTSTRCVLSTYPAPYEPPNTMMPCGSYALAPRGFDNAGILSFEGVPITVPIPMPTPWLAGGLMFAPAAFFDEVPYDPRVYFLGEEVSLAARGWTRGWDFHAPSVCVLHHHYGRRSDPKHWGDNRGWTDTNAVSVRRVRHLLGISQDRDPSVIEALDGPLGLGSARTLAEYERFAGVDFARQMVLRR